jgi:hypothetical protein
MNVNANSDLLSQKQSQELPSLPCHVHVPIALLPASKVDLDESLGRHHRRGRESKPFVAAPACTPAFGLSRLILLVGLSSSNLLLLPFLSLSPTKPLPFKYPNEPPY